MNKKIFKQQLLDELYAPYKNCMLCPLATMGRTHVVFGRGNADAQLLIIGEGPGRDEDLQGKPFVGRSGKLLSKALDALFIPEDEIYISNIVKCRPPGNRAPLPSEASVCMNILLKQQIAIIRPTIICTLGSSATHFLLDTKTPISQLRGRIVSSPFKIPVLPTFHPAYILRNPKELHSLVADLTVVKETLLNLKNNTD